MGRRSNHLDLLRLLFAALVIFSHSFELALGTGHEPLEGRVGNVGSGGLAVQGFFVLSGYLISSSWLAKPDILAYLRNRFLRIVPAFVVAFVCSIALAICFGARPDWPRTVGELLTLHAPTTPLPGPYSREVNGAMWTIQAEVACYLLAPLAVFRRTSLIALWLCAALVAVLTPIPQATWALMFLSGAAYRVFRLSALPPWHLAALAVGLALLPSRWGWEVGLATFGAFGLLGLGLLPARRVFPDISYGVYLYGWPVQQALILLGLGTPWLLFPLSLFIAGVFAVASWFGVERRALHFKQRVPLAPVTSPA